MYYITQDSVSYIINNETSVLINFLEIDKYLSQCRLHLFVSVNELMFKYKPSGKNMFTLQNRYKHASIIKDMVFRKDAIFFKFINQDNFALKITKTK